MRQSLLIVILGILLLQRSAMSQTLQDSAFRLIYLSNTISYDAKLLSSEIKSQRSLEDVRNLVRKKIIATQGLLVVLFRRNGNIYRWQRKFGDMDTKETEWIVMGSRGSDEESVSSAAEFRQKFYGKRVIIDSLVLRLNFNTANFPPAQYYLRFSCGNEILSSPVKLWPPARLVLTKELLPPACVTDTALSVEFFNSAHPDILLAKFRIIFPTTSLKQQWKQVAAGIGSAGLGDTGAEQLALLQSWIGDNYGYCSVQELEKLLRE